ncbi:MAG TPA: rod shape-determining protein MreD [Streptosporangiaceae bacterium]
MRRVLLPAALVVVALLLQLTLLDQLPLPGGVSPDLLLLVVVALALSSGPTPGLITGFCAGLALDVAPPSNHLIGVYALVFCLAGYFCGLVAADLENSVLLPLAASALGAAGGAALYAVAGVFLGNPDVTGQAVRHVLPLSVAYDVLLSPFVLYAVALASRLAARIAGVVTTGASPLAVPGAASALQGGRTLRIRAANRQRDGWIGGGGWLAASAELARSRPPTVKLHLGGKNSRLPARPQGASQQGKSLAKLRFGSRRRGDGIVGSRLLGGGLFGGFTGGGLPLLSRHSRPGTPARVRFSSKPAWGLRGSGGPAQVSAAAPRRGTFSTNTRKVTVSAATPRRGTFTAAPQHKRQVPAGSPRRGTFSGGSSAKGTFGTAGPRRGAFGGGPRGLRALRRATIRGGRIAGTRRSAIGRVRDGRSTSWGRSSSWSRSSWRNGFKRNGGWR